MNSSHIDVEILLLTNLFTKRGFNFNTAWNYAEYFVNLGKKFNTTGLEWIENYASSALRKHLLGK